MYTQQAEQEALNALTERIALPVEWTLQLMDLAQSLSGAMGGPQSLHVDLVAMAACVYVHIKPGQHICQISWMLLLRCTTGYTSHT